MKTDFIIRAIKEAIREHGNPEIINSDQGSQFTSKDYIDCIKSFESINISMDGKGRAKDNARTERFFRSYKWERLYLLYPETVPELKQMTRDYIRHYNWDRPHQSLDYTTHPLTFTFVIKISEPQRSCLPLCHFLVITDGVGAPPVKLRK